MMRSTRLLTVVSELKYSLECVGLSIYDVVYQSPPPSKGITTDGIQQALHAICSSHDLPIAQVWISNYHVPSSSDTDPTKPPFLVKAASYSALTEDVRRLLPAYHFYNCSHILPVRIVEGGLVEKTLQTRRPHFSKDIHKLKANGLLGLLSATTNCSSFVMCLRSTRPEEDNVDYIFEFLWPQSRNHIILLESMLLLTLKKCLPGFNFTSGAQFDEELYVTDADNSAQIAIVSFHNLRGMRPEAHQEVDDDDYDDDGKDIIIVARYKRRVTLLVHTDSSLSQIPRRKLLSTLAWIQLQLTISRSLVIVKQ
uniref:uncharacterized protein LOC122584699 n=1 Tax=Erigeron canadensis TaxID=72917 RepID=UPI001CB93EEE|nr:uncharacterized protein LOC122584699 [Erigeron canadensis]